MAKHGEVIRLPVRQFGYEKWFLTEKGREILKKKPKPKRGPYSLPRKKEPEVV